MNAPLPKLDQEVVLELDVKEVVREGIKFLSISQGGKTTLFPLSASTNESLRQSVLEAVQQACVSQKEFFIRDGIIDDSHFDTHTISRVISQVSFLNSLVMSLVYDDPSPEQSEVQKRIDEIVNLYIEYLLSVRVIRSNFYEALGLKHNPWIHSAIENFLRGPLLVAVNYVLNSEELRKDASENITKITLASKPFNNIIDDIHRYSVTLEGSSSEGEFDLYDMATVASQSVHGERPQTTEWNYRKEGK